ncbi:MAG TPA: hypothetical protein VJT31_42585 [Rugosimonospora sp.]|nr:hypothetical protein [Rugosimonospora sp.]
MTAQSPSPVGMAVLAVAALVLAGCAQMTASSGTGSTPVAAGAAASPAAQASPTPSMMAARQALLASVNHMTTTIYRFTGGQEDLTTHGHADPVHRAASLAATGTMQGMPFNQDVIAIGTNYWIKLDLGAQNDTGLGIDPTKWMHLDATKLGKAANLPFDLAGAGDVLDITGLLDAVGTAQRVDATHYTGTIDMTVAAGVSAMTQENLTKLGAKAKTMPFSATLDDQGRLTELIVDGSAVDKALGARFAFMQFGKAFPINRPVHNVVEAPAGVYDLFKH